MFLSVAFEYPSPHTSAQAKKELKALFDLLPQDEKNAVLGIKGFGKAPAKEAPVAVVAPGVVVDLTVDDDKTASKLPSQSKPEDEENNPVSFSASLHIECSWKMLSGRLALVNERSKYMIPRSQPRYGFLQLSRFCKPNR
jgi:hypothetical protein